MKHLIPLLLALSWLFASAQPASEDPVETLPPSTENYQLAPLDSIAISVFDEPDLGVSQRISARGEVFVPLLGAIHVAGLSVEQIKARIEEEYVNKEILRHPQVTVSITGFSPKRITFLGEIADSVSLPDGANYLEIETAIAMAGGLTSTSRQSAIRVTRKDENGVDRVIVVDLDDVLDDHRGIATTRFRVYPGDIIFVPRKVF